MTSLIVVMGVSGSGKTLVGTHLARQLGIEFVDGDHLHSAENVTRMRSGIAMNDETRKPWLKAICDCAESKFCQNQSVVIACSALKAQYRSALRTVSKPVVFVFLDADPGVIQTRLNQRTGHYMPPSLLDSQYADLENPVGEPNVIAVDVGQSKDSTLQEALEKTRQELTRISEVGGESQTQ